MFGKFKGGGHNFGSFLSRRLPLQRFVFFKCRFESKNLHQSERVLEKTTGKDFLFLFDLIAENCGKVGLKTFILDNMRRYMFPHDIHISLPNLYNL